MPFPCMPHTAPGFFISEPIPLGIGVPMTARQTPTQEDSYMIRKKKTRAHNNQAPKAGHLSLSSLQRKSQIETNFAQ